MEDKRMHSVSMKGRGTIITATINRKAEEKNSASGVVQAFEEPPQPRGRTGLLNILKKLRPLQVGATSNEPSTSQTVLETTHLTEKMPEMNIRSKSYTGESGKHMMGTANYISLKMEPNRYVYEYEVKFIPTIDSKSAANQILSTEIERFCSARIFDGHKLYMPVKLINDRKEFNCVHPYSNEGVIMLIIYKNERSMDDCEHLYNVLMNRIMRILLYTRVGRNFHDTKNINYVPQYQLEIWPGYCTSVCKQSGGLLLCLDLQHRVLRTQNVLGYMYDIIHVNKTRYKQFIESTLIGSSVLTRYNNRTYIVHDILWEGNPLCTFENRSGNKISYLEYYKKQYNIEIMDHKQPLLVHRATVRNADMDVEDRLVILIPEISYMTGLTDQMRSDYKVMKEIAHYTQLTPSQRMVALQKYIANVKGSKEAQEILSNWGLEMDKATIDLNTRILDPETILFGNNVKVETYPPADWNMVGLHKPVLLAVDMWMWTLFYTSQDRQNASNFVEHMLRLGPKVGLKIMRPQTVCLENDHNETYKRVLQSYIDDATRIICVICPTNRDDRYCLIKKICCTGCPVASQVILSKTLRNPNKLPTIVQKIALQMNCKLGGALWSVRFPFKNWMVCGIDVCHSNCYKSQAVCAFISSINNSMSQWYSNTVFHKKDEEISAHLKPLFANALIEYKNTTGEFPSHVIVYRDGVGNGQLETSKKFEVPQLLSAIKAINAETKLVYIIVQKRISTRIFVNRDDYVNPPPGTVVDNTVTRENLLDFFLISQSIRQGTVTPTHYIILYDNSCIKPDYIQRLTFKLCHMYYNWMGTVRVPAPCQYAHKLAYLIGQCVRAEPSRKLCNTLFYL